MSESQRHHFPLVYRDGRGTTRTGFHPKGRVTLFDAERFWERQTVYDDRGSFRLFRVLKLFYALNEFMNVCKFCSFEPDEAKQSRIPIANDVKE